MVIMVSFSQWEYSALCPVGIPPGRGRHSGTHPLLLLILLLLLLVRSGGETARRATERVRDAG